MKIYEIVPNTDLYDSLYFVKNDGYKIMNHFLGYRSYDKAPKTWQPIPVAIDAEEKRGDFLGLSTCIVISKKARQILKLLIEESVDFLPLKCELEEFFTIKVKDRTDCLDHSRAKIERFPSSGRIMHVSSYAFKTEYLQEKKIFTIPESIARVFVTQRFKDYVRANQLEGLIFSEVYSEE